MPGPTHSPGEEFAEGGGRLIDFPTQDRPKPPPNNNLPLQLTSFIGREREIADLRKFLTTEARLVTLSGSGGSGKTRLALAVASEMVEGLEDGVWWVELASLSDPDLVAQAAASVLSVREVPGRYMRDALVEYLKEREVLLLLDNCEHLIEACASLATALLARCPGCASSLPAARPSEFPARPSSPSPRSRCRTPTVRRTPRAFPDTSRPACSPSARGRPGTTSR